MTDSDNARFTPPKSDGTVLKFQFFILPPLQQGDICAEGKTSRSMDLFYVPYGHHLVSGHAHVCPRIISEGEEVCPMCIGGFQLLKQLKAHNASKKEISATARRWLSQAANLVNIYFPAVKTNPEELHGHVRYFKAPKACLDHWMECLEREDQGDAEGPEAFGAFFDEVVGYLYELRIGRSGNRNDYGTGGFIAVDSTGKKTPGPIATKRNGEPDMKAIQAILDQRHDLWLKQGTADVAHLEHLVGKLRGR